jgi:PAS domain S-box-containing protein
MPVNLLSRRSQLVWLLAAILLITGIVGGGWFFLKRQEAVSRQAAEQALTSVADLKAEELESWMKERWGDAALVRVSQPVRELLAAPVSSTKESAVVEYFYEIQQAYDYELIALFDSRGTLLQTTSTNLLQQHSCVAEHVQSALLATNVVVVDLHRGRPGEPIHCSLLCPIRRTPQTNDPAAGVVLLMVNPQRFLYSFLERWPVPSQTAECILLRREGEELVYLNETRRCRGTALSLRIPLTRTEMPVVRAALGERGITIGLDYRGVPVVAVAREVRGTAWLLVAKLDQAEVNASFYQDARMTTVAIGLALLAALLGISLLWRQQRLRSIKQELAERERTAAARQRSEQKFASLFQFSPDAIFLISPTEQRIAEVNDAACRFCGFAREELLGHTIDEFGFWTEAPQWDQYRAAVRDRGRIVDFETELRVKSGVWRRCLISSEVILLEEQPYRLSVVRDITERKEAEAQLRLQETRLRLALEAADLVNWEFDCATRRLTYSSNFATLVGELNLAPLSSLEGFTQRLHSDDRERVECSIRQTIQAGVPFDSDYRLRLEDGSWHWFASRGRAVAEADGRFVRVVGVTQDITERKQTEISLRESEALRRAILDNMPDPAWLKDLHGRFLAVNDAWCRFTGRRAAQVIGRMDSELFPPEVVAAFRKQENEVVAVRKVLRLDEELVDAQD